MDRGQLYQQIMENPTTDLFYRLINRNRKKTTGTTSCMEIDGKLDYSEDNQRHAFARIMKTLAHRKMTHLTIRTMIYVIYVKIWLSTSTMQMNKLYNRIPILMLVNQ